MSTFSMEGTRNDSDGIPSEMKDRLGNFDAAISQVESLLQPLLSTPHTDLVEKLGPLDVARLDLVGVYSINSLFWMYLNLCGVNPKEHAVKKELERVRSYMTRIKEAQESLNKPRLDKSAAKRFVKSALWQNRQSKKEGDDSAKDSAQETPTLQPHDSEEATPPSKKRKNRK